MPLADYLWHPILVHFSVALLSLATVFYLLSALFPNAVLVSQWRTVAEWNLWVGTGLTLLTILFGWLAFNTVSHDDAAHEPMKLHALLGLVTASGFGLLTLWSFAERKIGKHPSAGFAAMIAICFGFLVVTGLRGGELVYHYGLAISSPTPAKEVVREPANAHTNHAHSHDAKGHSH